MKRMALFLLILPGIAMLCADDLVTRKEKVFSDYKIVEVAPIGIRITYQKEKKTRTATILFKELTDEFLEHYPGKDPVEREIFAASLDKRKKIRVLEEKRDARLEALEESEESLKERKLSPERRKQLRSRIREEKKEKNRPQFSSGVRKTGCGGTRPCRERKKKSRTAERRSETRKMNCPGAEHDAGNRGFRRRRGFTRVPRWIQACCA